MLYIGWQDFIPMMVTVPMKKNFLFAIVISGIALSSSFAQEAQEKKNSPEQIFNDRIMPIFRSEKPSSCIQCHLASVDLKNYILPSHEKTFVSLRDQGLIDLKNPEKSKILHLIAMGYKDADLDAKRIHEKMRAAELAAFTNWIKASCADEKMRKLPALEKSQQAKPAYADEVIRFTRKSRIVDSFTRKIWSQRMRCFPCHTPHQIGPRQKNARKAFEKWQSQFGEQMEIFKKTPEETMQYLIEESRKDQKGNLPLLNLEDPTKSLLVLKPMSKVPPKIDEKRTPTYKVPVYHLGGLKIHKDDHSYKSFVSWIEDYAKTTTGKYTSVKNLPADNWFPTQRILRIKDLPDEWAVGTTVQMFVYAKNNQDNLPVAFTQGTITRRKIANGALILLAPTDPAARQKWRKSRNRLPAGEYQVKVFVDRKKKLEKTPTAFLGPKEFAGQLSIKQAKWRVGFPKAEWISAKMLQPDNKKQLENR